MKTRLKKEERDVLAIIKGFKEPTSRNFLIKGTEYGSVKLDLILSILKEKGLIEVINDPVNPNNPGYRIK